MSDFKGIEISDVLGLSQPLTKLIETVSCGIGTLYAPMHIKRMAKAKAKEIEIISDTITESLTLPMNYQNGNISIDTTNANELVQRAQNRFLFQEMKKQQNIESVIGYAYSNLEKEEFVSDESVSEDWISVFFNSVANVSSEQLQKIWAIILVGEIKTPGSVSLRTLNVLKNMAQKDAEKFEELIPYVLNAVGNKAKTSQDYFILGDLYGRYGFDYAFLESVADAGLLSVNSDVSTYICVDAHGEETIEGRKCKIKIYNKKEYPISINSRAYMLTQAGKELYEIVSEKCEKEAPADYLNECNNVFADSLADKDGNVISSDSIELQIVAL